MSGTTGSREALKEVAALASSGKPLSEVVDRVLESARVAAGATCLSLVAALNDLSDVRSWTARTEAAHSTETRCLDAGRAACVSTTATTTPADLALRSIDCSGLRAVVVADVVSDEAMFNMACSYISLMLANDQLQSDLALAKDQVNKRITEVSAVYEIGNAINELDLSRLLPLLTEKAAAVMDAQACSLLMRDFVSNTLSIETSWGLADDIVKGTRIALGEGIAGQVARTGEAMLFHDIANDPRLAEGSVRPREGIVSSICAPLKDEQGRTMGVLTIRRHKPAPRFTEEDLRLFCVFAGQAALAISNAKLYTSLTRRIAEMSTISDLLRVINSTLDLNDVLDQISNSIIEVVDFDRCCIYLHDPRSNEYVAWIVRGFEEGELPERVQMGDGTIGLAAKEQISVFEQASDPGRTEQQYAAFLATPIVVRDSCIGVVAVDKVRTGRPIQQPEVELLSTFVSQAGIAIENARLYEAMEEKYAEMNVLFEHSKTISSAYGLENVAHISTAVARRAVECDGCILLLLGDRRNTIALQAAAGVPQDLISSVRKRLSEMEAVEYVKGLRSPAVVDAKNSENLAPSMQAAFAKLVGENGSALVVPLLAEDVTVGVFLLIRSEVTEYDTGEIKLLSIVASQAAVVLKNALRYEQRMKRQVLDLSTLYEFSRRISSSSNLEEALDAILAIVADLVDCDESSIFAIDHDRDTMVATAARGGGLSARMLPELPLSGNSVMSWTVRERKAIVSPDIANDSRFDPLPSSPLERPVRSLMSIPLMVQDDAVGVLCVCSSSPNLYSEDDVRVLSIIASQSAAIYKELEALAALTSYTDNILSSIAAGVITLDGDGIVLTWNQAAEAITELRGVEVVGGHYSEIISLLNITDQDKATTAQIVEQVKATGEVYQGYKQCFHLINYDPVYMNLSASVLWNNVGDPIGQVIIFEDITKEIKMEDDFRRMGELAAVGQLAASIAHELRNPLSSIKGAAQFLQKEYEDESAISEFLGIIIDEVNGLSKLTTEFLEYARPMEFEIGPVDINGIVRKTLQLMSVHVVESGVSIDDRTADELPIVQADGKQIEQVLRNMILNAVQAMPEGGTLSIETNSNGPYVEMTVSDTGVGIPEEKLKRVFLPFFTTKTKGTGLGLSVVQKIIENHGGRIEVASTVGEGTSLKVVLPQAGRVRIVPPESESTDRRQ